MQCHLVLVWFCFVLFCFVLFCAPLHLLASGRTGSVRNDEKKHLARFVVCCSLIRFFLEDSIRAVSVGLVGSIWFSVTGRDVG